MNVYNQPQYQFDLLLHIYNGTTTWLVHLTALIITTLYLAIMVGTIIRSTLATIRSTHNIPV